MKVINVSLYNQALSDRMMQVIKSQALHSESIKDKNK